jgi:hypothetical protein
VNTESAREKERKKANEKSRGGERKTERERQREIRQAETQETHEPGIPRPQRERGREGERERGR